MTPISKDISQRVINEISPLLSTKQTGLPYMEVLFCLGVFAVLVIFVIVVRKPQ